MKIALPQNVQQIINTIEAAGYEAYAVGGCVRDSILGRAPDDWDITTSAKPLEVKALFHRTVDTGLKHGTVTVLMGKEGYEVTTYRIDGEYEDSRHPKEVIFTSNLIEDLKRRDFTINAMAYNERTGLVDAFEGIQDIDKKRIRCVGDPMERFTEDALRMMRAIRFSAQLGYDIEEETMKAVSALAPNLEHISAERIQVELVKLVTSAHPDYLRKAYETGITKVILPEFDQMMETPQNNPHHCYTVGEHTLHGMMNIEANKVLRLAMLLHDIGKPSTKTTDAQGIDHFKTHGVVGEEMAKLILRRLKFDNDTIYKVSRLVYYHDYGNGVEPDMRMIRRAMNKIGEDIFPMLIPVRRADMLSQSDYDRATKEHYLRKLEECYDRIIEEKQCVSLRTLALNGSDLMEHDAKSGPGLGKLLQELLQYVIEEPDKNTAEDLFKKLKELQHTFPELFIR